MPLHTCSRASLIATIVDTTGEAVLTADDQRRVCSWNEAAEDLLGWTAAEAVGRPVDFFIPPDRHSEIRRFDRMARSGVPVRNQPTSRLRSDGSRVAVTLTLTPLQDDDGRFVGTVAMFRKLDFMPRAAPATSDRPERLPSEGVGPAESLELLQALEGGELRLLHQPLVSLADGRICGTEALLRWERDGRLLGPESIVPVAETTGLIVALGAWVLRTAAAEAAAWQPRRPGVGVAVNVSSYQLLDAGFVDQVVAAVDVLGDPTLLTLELTEHSALQGDGRVLEALRALGVHLAIDDFGTGYSSLAYLRDLAVDQVKIDRTFVARLAEPRGRVIVEAVLAIADAFGLDVVAEGIETAAQAEQLAALGCRTGQGFYYAPPLPSAELFRRSFTAG